MNPVGHEQQLAVFARLNDTRVAFPTGETIHGLFQAQAARKPQDVAIRDAEVVVTFAELDEQANWVAARLRARGVGPGSVIAIYAHRSARAIAGLLGILKTGSAYLALDPSYPNGRLGFMLKDSNAALLVVDDEEAPVWIQTSGVTQVPLSTRPWAEDAPDGPAAFGLDDAGAACIIYTSGSTGQPKGIVASHAATLNRFRWMWDEYPLQRGELCAHWTPWGFVDHIWEVFGPILAGATLVVLSDEMVHDPVQLVEQLDRHGISRLGLVPSFLSVLLGTPEFDGDRLPALDLCVSSGEALPVEVAARFQTSFPRATLLNLYGSTEVGADVTVHEVTEADLERDTVPIGRPIANTQVYICDAQGQRVPAGVSGELYVGGAQVSSGYVNRPDLTRQRFVPDRFGSDAGHRLFKTGDLVRLGAGDELELIGRIDNQVKLHGVRIEPAEVEAVLQKHPAVRQAVVKAWGEEMEGRRLAGYVTVNDAVTADALQQHARRDLPRVMVPTSIAILDEFPLTPSGKIDREGLLAPESLSLTDFIEPSTEAERTLARIYSDVLGGVRVGAADRFYEIGGDSLLAMQVVARAYSEGLRVSPVSLVETDPLAAVAAATVEVTAVEREQPITGPVKFAPNSIRFLNRGSPSVDQWNLSAVLGSKILLEPVHLARALEELIRHHDALRLSLTHDGTRWSQKGRPPDPKGNAPFESFDLTGLTVEEEDRQKVVIANRLQQSLDLDRGPRIRLAHFVTDGGDSGRAEELAVIVHHLSADLFSLDILIDDLQTVYAQLRSGGAVRLPPKTSSYQAWTDAVKAYTTSPTALDDLARWLDAPWSQVAPIPRDFSSAPAENINASARGVTVALDTTQTAALLTDERHGAPEILVAALVEALGDWSGTRTLLLDILRHSRSGIADELDLTRTVGMFISYTPLVIEAEPGSVPVRLEATSRKMLSWRDRGWTFDALRYLGPPSVRAQLSGLPRADVLFNYWGRPLGRKPNTFLIPRNQPAGSDQAPNGVRDHPLAILAEVTEARLEVSFVYSERIHRGETIQSLAHAFWLELKESLREDHRATRPFR